MLPPFTFNLGLQLRPASESISSSDNPLSIAQRNLKGAKLGVAGVLQAGKVLADTGAGARFTRAKTLEEGLGLLAQVLQTGTRGKKMSHNGPLFDCARCPHTGLKGAEYKLPKEVGFALPADWMLPRRARVLYRGLRTIVKQHVAVGLSIYRMRHRLPHCATSAVDSVRVEIQDMAGNCRAPTFRPDGHQLLRLHVQSVRQADGPSAPGLALSGRPKPTVGSPVPAGPS